MVSGNPNAAEPKTAQRFNRKENLWLSMFKFETNHRRKKLGEEANHLKMMLENLEMLSTALWVGEPVASGDW
jgi:hypothetical protein